MRPAVLSSSIFAKNNGKFNLEPVIGCFGAPPLLLCPLIAPAPRQGGSLSAGEMSVDKAGVSCRGPVN